MPEWVLTAITWLSIVMSFVVGFTVGRRQLWEVIGRLKSELKQAEDSYEAQKRRADTIDSLEESTINRWSKELLEAKNREERLRTYIETLQERLKLESLRVGAKHLRGCK